LDDLSQFIHGVRTIRSSSSNKSIHIPIPLLNRFNNRKRNVYRLSKQSMIGRIRNIRC
jgi:hypothetical protein